MAVDCSLSRVLVLEWRAENLRKLLKEVERKGRTPLNREQPVSVEIDRDLWSRIRQALHREEGDRS